MCRSNKSDDEILEELGLDASKSEIATLDYVLTSSTRFWVLRLLSTCGGLPRFVRPGGFSNDSVAQALGFSVTEDSERADKAEGVEKSAKFDRDGVVAEIKRQLGELEAHMGALRASADPLDVNIVRLQEFLGLCDGEAHLLHLVVSLHTSEAIGMAAKIVKDFCKSRSAVVILAAVLGASQAQVRQWAGEGGSLVRMGLVRVCHQGDLDDRVKPLSEEFARALCEGVCEPEELLRELVRLPKGQSPARVDFEHMGEIVDTGLAYLRASMGAGQSGTHVLVRGDDKNCVRQFVQLLADELGVGLVTVCADDDDESVRGYYLAQAICRVRPGVVSLTFDADVFRRISSDVNGVPCPAPTLWLAGSGCDDWHPWRSSTVKVQTLERMSFVLHIKSQPEEIRMRWIEQQCGGLLPAAVVKQFSENKEMTRQIVTQAVAAHKVISASIPDGQQAQAMERILGAFVLKNGETSKKAESASALPEVYDSRFINTDGDVEKLIDGIRHSGSARVCLYGLPGTGKTAFGHYLAHKLGKALQVERCSDILNKYLGETEQNIAKIFARAKREKNVLLIDEVDSFLQNRSMAVRTWEVTHINEMLTQMESFDGVFMASTNRLESLDPAVLRRFDLKIRFDALREEQAWELLGRHLKNAGLAGPADAAVGTEIECLRAKLTELREITPGDFASVARRTRFYPLADANAWVEALAEECRLKMASRGAENSERASSIGFHAHLGR